MKMNVVGFESDGQELKQEVEESTQPQRLDRLVDETTLWLETNRDKVYLDGDGTLHWREYEDKDEDKDRNEEFEVPEERPQTSFYLCPTKLTSLEVGSYLNGDPTPLGNILGFELILPGQVGGDRPTTFILRRELCSKEESPFSLHSQIGNCLSKCFSLKEGLVTFVLLAKSRERSLVCVLTDCQISLISYEGWSTLSPEEILTFQVGDVIPWFRLL